MMLDPELREVIGTIKASIEHLRTDLDELKEDVRRNHSAGGDTRRLLYERMEKLEVDLAAHFAKTTQTLNGHNGAHKNDNVRTAGLGVGLGIVAILEVLSHVL